jgi:hypothetical protein
LLFDDFSTTRYEIDEKKIRLQEAPPPGTKIRYFILFSPIRSRWFIANRFVYVSERTNTNKTGVLKEKKVVYLN